MHCIEFYLEKVTHHTVKMNTFSIIFVICFIVVSIKANKVEVFGDIENKKCIGQQIITERADRLGNIVRTTKFPKVMIEITISSMVF